MFIGDGLADDLLEVGTCFLVITEGEFRVNGDGDGEEKEKKKRERHG